MPTQLTLRLPSRRSTVTWVLAVPAVAIVATGDVLTALAGGDATSVLGRASRYFSADGEANIWSWYSGLVLSLVGLAFLLLATGVTTRTARRAVVVLAVVAFYLSADEVAGLHELLFQPAAAVGLGPSGWLAFGIPLALIGGAIVFVVARSIEPRLRRGLVVAGAVFLVGAVGLEAVNEFLLGDLALQPWSPLYLIEVSIEEGLEFAGGLLAVVAVMGAIGRTAEADMSAAQAAHLPVAA